MEEATQVQGNLILTFSVKSGVKKTEYDNRLIPWYYNLVKTTVSLRRNNYIVFPIPRFIVQSPPPNNGEHVAKGTEKLRIYLPKKQSVPGFILKSVPIDCIHLE